jgi:carbamoyl-phosphate synthase large subunit
MSNILITSAGRRVSLVKAFIKELELLVPEAKVFVSDMNPNLSAAAQVAHKAFKICKIEEDCYIESLYNVCIENDIKLIIPTLDTELQKLSEIKKKFLKANIQIVISDQNLIKMSSNKTYSNILLSELGIDIIKEYSKDIYKIPLFIKPIAGSSSINNHIITNKMQLSQYHLENDDLHFFEYIDHNIYDEYTCDLYYSKLGELKCIIPRKRIEIRGGEVSKGITRKNEVKVLIKEKLSHLKGAKGCITLQLFMHKITKEMKAIEINPRFGGGFPLSYLAGGNYPKWIIQEYLFNQDIEYFDNWQEDLLMLRYDDEILVNDYKE